MASSQWLIHLHAGLRSCRFGMSITTWGPDRLTRSGHIRNGNLVFDMTLPKASTLALEYLRLSREPECCWSKQHSLPQLQRQHGVQHPEASSVSAGDSCRVCRHHQDGPTRIPSYTSAFSCLRSTFDSPIGAVLRIQMVHISIPSEPAQKASGSRRK